MASLSEQARLQPGPLAARFNAWLCGVLGYAVLAATGAVALSLLTWNTADPSLTHAASGPVRNALGPIGAILSDLVMQLLGLAGVFVILPLIFWALQLIGDRRLDRPRTKLLLAPLAVLLLACAASSLPKLDGWPLDHNVGGLLGDVFLSVITSVLARIRPERASAAAGLFCVAGGLMLLLPSLGMSRRDLNLIFQRPQGLHLGFVVKAWQRLGEMSERAVFVRREPSLRMPARPFPPAPAFDAPAPALYPAVQPFTAGSRAAPDPLPPPCDDDIDPSELKRIVSICAPERAGKAIAARDQPDILLPAEPAQDYHPRGPAEPAPRPRAHAGHIAPWPAPDESALRPRAPMPPPAGGWRPQSLPGGDDLYGRAVTIVLDDRKASADYLQQRLQIGYMRATDLIERMEREGILGAPVYNGLRPILIGGGGSREI